MTYSDQAGLASDPDFNGRLQSALTTEGRADVADPLSKLVMNSPAQGASVFIPFISSAPGFADKYGAGGQESITDGDILSAVQASWADVATVQGLTP
jgi:hypothetical protein